MTQLEYLVTAVNTCGLEVKTEASTTSRGVMIVPQTFDVTRLYGKRPRKITFRVRATFVGGAVSDGTLFDVMEALTTEIEKDQTAGGIAEQVQTTAWNGIEIEKNYAVFETNVTISE